MDRAIYLLVLSARAASFQEVVARGRTAKPLPLPYQRARLLASKLSCRSGVHLARTHFTAMHRLERLDNISGIAMLVHNAGLHLFFVLTSIG